MFAQWRQPKNGGRFYYSGIRLNYTSYYRVGRIKTSLQFSIILCVMLYCIYFYGCTVRS